ncbi:MAG: hypothetical protein PHY16_15365 [Methylobacter sp.]|nr:hypothetical protein [Methylobacter sp.]
MNHSLSTNNSKIITGLFLDKEIAERAYRSLIDRGYRKADVSLVMSDNTHQLYFSDDRAAVTELGSKAAQGAGIGGAIGGTLAATVAAIMAMGTSLVLPGLGLIIAGPIAAALAGAGAGSVTGGLVGALIGAGIPEERVKYYEEGLKQGGILIGVNPYSKEDATYFEQQWQDSFDKQIR